MAYKQGYNDRKDESRGMKKYYSSSHNESYMSKGMGGKVMGHDKSPSKIDVPVGNGFSEVKTFHEGYKGYPRQAFDYKY